MILIKLLVSLVLFAVIGSQMQVYGAACDNDSVKTVLVDKIILRAKQTHSDALYITRDGKVIAQWFSSTGDKPLEAMSITKSVANLAIGKLIDQGKISSVDEPISNFYPQWRNGDKQKITLRHLLNHTSGIACKPTTEEIYASPNFIDIALQADLSEKPGAKFRYNNKAVNLLAGIVEKASGIRMDLYLAQEIFAPLGIKNFAWTLDKAGNPHGMAGLQIKASDLAKIGQLMADCGAWQGKQVISCNWVKESTRQGQPYDYSCGLLWWLEPATSKVTIDDATITRWRDNRAVPDLVEKMEEFKGQSWDVDVYQEFVQKTLGPRDWARWVTARKLGHLPAATISPGPIIGFSGRGYLGQYLIVLPRVNVVAVRMIEAKNHKSEADDFSDFAQLVKELANE